MKRKKIQGVSIIGGADGPTSIFIAGRSKDQPLHIRIRNLWYRIRYRVAEKTIHAGTHTLEEVLQYACSRYELTEKAQTDRSLMEQRKSWKEGLVLQHYPDLLGEWKTIPTPEAWDEESVKAYIQQTEQRSKWIEQLPEDAVPMDFHLYEIQMEEGQIEIMMDFVQDGFGISYSGDGQKIMRELYRYYGVSEEDIQNRTSRYKALAAALSS